MSYIKELEEQNEQLQKKLAYMEIEHEDYIRRKDMAKKRQWHINWGLYNYSDNTNKASERYHIHLAGNADTIRGILFDISDKYLSELLHANHKYFWLWSLNVQNYNGKWLVLNKFSFSGWIMNFNGKSYMGGSNIDYFPMAYVKPQYNLVKTKHKTVKEFVESMEVQHAKI